MPSFSIEAAENAYFAELKKTQWDRARSHGQQNTELALDDGSNASTGTCVAEWAVADTLGPRAQSDVEVKLQACLPAPAQEKQFHLAQSSYVPHQNKIQELEERLGRLRASGVALAAADASHENSIQVLSGDLMKLKENVDMRFDEIWCALKKKPSTFDSNFDLDLELPKRLEVANPGVATTSVLTWQERLKLLESKLDFIVAGQGINTQPTDAVHEGDQFKPSEALVKPAEIDGRLMSLQAQLELALSEQQDRVLQLERCVLQPTECPASDIKVDDDGQASSHEVHAERERLEKLRKQLMREAVHRKLGGTAWDAAIFVGIGKTSAFDSFVLAMALVLTAMTQGMLLLLLTSKSFTESQLPSEDIMRTWRIREAHDAKHVDRLTHTNLVTRVCGADASLTTASSQIETLASIQAYLEDLPVMSFAGSGLVTCLVAISVFAMTVHAVAWNSALLVFAIVELPSSAHTEFHVSILDEDGQTGMELKSISFLRRLALIIISMGVALGAYFLLPIGCFWLSHTIQVSELVLNATALSFVLEIDRVIYSSLVPHHLQAEVERIKPLKVKFRHGLLDIVPQIVCGCVVCFATCFSYFHILKDQAEQMEAIEEVMCGGNKTFTFAVVPSTTVVIVTLTEQYGKGLLPGYRYLEGITSAKIGGTPLTVASVTGLWPLVSFSQFASVAKDGFVEALLCMDSFDTGTQYMPSAGLKSATLREYNMSAQKCADMEEQCDGNHQALLLRSVCPVTCGCASTISGMLWRTSYFGCPSAQCSVSEYALIERKELPCQDLEAADVMMQPIWSVTNQRAACGPWWNHLNSQSVDSVAPQNQTTPATALACRVLGWNRYFTYILENENARSRMVTAATATIGLYASGNHTALTNYVNDLRVQGCDFLQMLAEGTGGSYMVAQELCLGTSLFSGLRAFCPRWCKCTPTLSDCPSKCSTSPTSSTS